MIKNIIFDWSGVIKDAALSHLWVVNKMFKHFGADEISFDEMRENWEQPYMRFYNKYLPNLTIEEEQKIYRKTVMDSGCPKSEAYDGIVDLIKKFKKNGIYMVVLSSDLPDTLLPEIERFGLSRIFEEVITDAHDKAEVIHGLIKRNNFNSEETIFIGDSNHEVEAGRKENIKTAAVVWGFSTENKLKSAKPDFLVHDIKELEEILLK